MDEVKCSVCGNLCSRKRSRGIYVEAAGVQYVCFTCRKLPFDEVMDAMNHGTVYVRGTAYESIVEMERAMIKT